MSKLTTIYLILIVWCFINIFSCIISFNLTGEVFWTLIIFFAGAFIILLFAMVEAIKEDRRRNAKETY